MSSVYKYEGLILLDNGLVATSEDCCCDESIRWLVEPCDCGPNCDASISSLRVVDIPISESISGNIINGDGMCYSLLSGHWSGNPSIEAVVSYHDTCDDCCCGSGCICVGEESDVVKCCFSSGSELEYYAQHWYCGTNDFDCANVTPGGGYTRSGTLSFYTANIDYVAWKGYLTTKYMYVNSGCDGFSSGMETPPPSSGSRTVYFYPDTGTWHHSQYQYQTFSGNCDGGSWDWSYCDPWVVFYHDDLTLTVINNNCGGLP